MQFPPAAERESSNVLTAKQLARFLATMKADYPYHYGLAVVLAYTGLRFCHASALRWEDWDEDQQVLLVSRRQVRGEVAPISRKKQAPRQVPVLPDLADVLRWHQRRLLEEQAPGLAAAPASTCPASAPPSSSVAGSPPQLTTSSMRQDSRNTPAVILPTPASNDRSCAMMSARVQ